jgi:ABC-type transporter Mla MlaB component
MTGVTPAIVVPIDKAMSARQQRAAARQQEAQRIQEQQDAATVSQLSKADTEGKNALTDLQRTMQGA